MSVNCCPSCGVYFDPWGAEHRCKWQYGTGVGGILTITTSPPPPRSQIAAQELRSAADEIRANVEAEIAAVQPSKLSRRGRERAKAKGHRMAASLSIARWLNARADALESPTEANR